MAKIISFFNHKGGVGKTTLAYNVAWGLSNENKRVLMIDADAQCNLTECSVEDCYLYDAAPDSTDEYTPNFFAENNIYEYFKGYVSPELGKNIPSVKTFKKKGYLELLPGSVRFAELERQIALSISNVPGLGHIPSNINTALKNIGAEFDYIIIDLSPAISATNQLLLMLSDYFIVPVTPSIFSEQALRNLYDVFREWNKELSGFEIFNRRTKQLPIMLGIVCQNYRPYSKAEEQNTKSASRFEKKLKELNDCAVTLATDLSAFKMALIQSEFNKLFISSAPYRIANIPDYNQLGQIAEDERKPVVGLDAQILRKHDKMDTPYYRGKVVDFQKECGNIVDGLLKLI